MNKSAQLGAVYVLTIILAACNIIYELLLAQTASFFCANTVVWYSLVIGIYLASMGLGALFYRRIFKGTNDWETLINVEILLSLIGGLAVILIHVLHMILSYIWINNKFFDMSWVFFLGIFAAVAVIGILSGCELPLLLKIGKEYSPQRNISNRILSADYLGSLLGAVLFPLVLLARFELITIGLFVAVINILAAGILQVFHEKKSFKLSATTIIFGVMLTGLIGSSKVEQYFLKKYYYYQESSTSLGSLFKSMKDWPDIKRLSSPYQKIDLVYYPPKEDLFEGLWEIYSQKFKKFPDFPKGYVLFIDGFFQFFLDIENINHEYFAHVPVILNDKVPQDVLVLGAGDGLLLRELVKYKDIKKITLVEIDSQMVGMAMKDPVLSFANNHALKDERIQVVIQDAYHFLRTARGQYDAIYMDFPKAKDYNLSKLYSREFYYFVFRSLKEDGFAVFDATEIGNDQQDQYWGIYFSTLKSAGFQSIVPYFSTLENDNFEAVQMLYPMFKVTHQLKVTQENSKEVKVIAGRDEIIKKIMQDFVHDHQNSFIMARKRDNKINRVYKSFGVEHLILNEQRFGLTLDRPVVINDLPSEDLINSIIRPTLPRKANLWKLRVPY